jgi:hypothetical protein
MPEIVKTNSKEPNGIIEETFRKLRDRWPSTWVARRKIGDFTGGIMGEGTIANLDSRGLGPPRVRIGRTIVAYPVDTLTEWLAAKMQPGGLDHMEEVRAQRKQSKGAR